MSDWMKALSDAVSETAEKVPKGWITTREFASIVKLSPPQANKQMRLLLDKGKAESKKFSIKIGSAVRPIPHYRLK